MPTVTPDPIDLREARLEKRERLVGGMIERVEFALTRMEAALGLSPWGAEKRPALLLVRDSRED